MGLNEPDVARPKNTNPTKAVDEQVVEPAPERTPAVEAVPVFMIKADQPGGIRALLAALAALGITDEKLVREFELWEERHRA